MGYFEPMTSAIPLQFKCINFHILTFISSPRGTGITNSPYDQYHRGHGCECCSSLNFSRLTTGMIIHLFILSSVVQMYEFSYNTIHFHLVTSTGTGI